ncbi:MAG: exodeoxyribonuclease VII small subunit [Marinifilaceae bacterium]
MTDKQLNYKDAMIELEELIASLEDNKLDIDQLSTKVKRISVLIKFCKSKLKDTETEVENILKEIE